MKIYKTDMHNPNDDLPDDDWEDFDEVDQEDDEPVWCCNSCNKTYMRNQPYNECPICSTILEEWYL